MKSAAIHSNSSLDLAPCEVAARCAQLPDAVFFDSAIEALPAISLIAAEPREIISGRTAAEWDSLRKKVHACQQRVTADQGIPCGMAAGYVEYDGAFRFAFYDEMLIHRHVDHSWEEVGRFAAKLPAAMAEDQTPAPHFKTAMTRKDFCGRVIRAQEYIAAGDIYQVNLAHRFTAPTCAAPWRLYEALRHYSPAPHAVYMRAGDRTILSASPECFLQMSGRHVRTRPIKGTRARHSDAQADEKSAFDLQTSPKEISELIMITDLERSDLGQICEYGSVHTSELLKLERYEQVFHLVSTVDGQLRERIDHVTALQKCFPGGSITGAPKVRAREIITELEPIPRGLYTGAIGYFGYNGESQFNIAIRTVVVEDGGAHFHVGAGIVADSIPELEYQETLDKAAGILLSARALEESSPRFA